jgi:ATP-dependent Clp protease ATP-binding subunit ClpA
VFELDLGSLVAGASYKGEIEERLKNIIKELKRFEK